MAFASSRAKISAGSLGDQEQVSAYADTPGNADIELKAKLKLMVGTVSSVTQAQQVNPSGYPTHAASGENYPVVFTLYKSGFPKRTYRVNQVSMAYALVGSLDGSVDITNADITALGAAIVDSDNVSGWAILAGKFEI